MVSILNLCRPRFKELNDLLFFYWDWFIVETGILGGDFLMGIVWTGIYRIGGLVGLRKT